MEMMNAEQVMQLVAAGKFPAKLVRFFRSGDRLVEVDTGKAYRPKIRVPAHKAMPAGVQ